MKSANNELTTARNTPNPIVAAGKDNAPVPGTSPIAPTSNQGLAVNLCCDSHHAMMAPMGTRTNSIVMLTARVSLSGACDLRRGLQAYIVDGEVNRIGPEERDPEVKLAAHLVQHSPGDLRVPVVDRTENHENGRHAHHHVKVGDNKHGVGQRNIHDWVAEEQPGQSPVHKRDDEGEGEQHRDREVNVAAPQSEHPVVDLDGRWDGDDERGGGE